MKVILASGADVPALSNDITKGAANSFVTTEWGIPWFQEAKLTINGVVVQTVFMPQYQFMLRFFQGMTKEAASLDPWFRLYDTQKQLWGGIFSFQDTDDAKGG